MQVILNAGLEDFHPFLPSSSTFSVDVCLRVVAPCRLVDQCTRRYNPEDTTAVEISSRNYVFVCISIFHLGVCLVWLSVSPSFHSLVLPFPREKHMDRLGHVKRIAFRRVVCIVAQQCTLLPIVRRTDPLVLRATWSWGDLFVYIVLLKCGLPAAAAATWRRSRLHTVQWSSRFCNERNPSSNTKLHNVIINELRKNSKSVVLKVCLNKTRQNTDVAFK
jgi:hypothetical protein